MSTRNSTAHNGRIEAISLFPYVYFYGYFRGMSRWDAYLKSGVKIVESYDGKIPLSAWLKDFFRQHKQMGSGDRKIISQLCYSFYRTGHSMDHLSLEERLLTSLFLCSSSGMELLAYLKPLWNEQILLSVQEKTILLEQEGLYWKSGAIFPWTAELSDAIDKDLFNRSHLVQPLLFLRIRPGKEHKVVTQLSRAGIAFTRLEEDCLVLANATKVNLVLQVDKDVVIQDYNSQRAGSFFKLQELNAVDKPLSVWDCCAGSGGKSVLAYDQNSLVRLTVSDIRASILQNLAQRFKIAGINNYEAMVTNFSGTGSRLPKEQFDCIIADLPCSGSGTWSRTPEQLYFFDPLKIDHYSNLQKKILSKVIPKLMENGRLVYITCSVFRRENEDIAYFIQQHFGLVLEKMEVLTGYEMQADTMFVAVFRKV